jgi:hypothetical protein
MTNESSLPAPIAWFLSRIGWIAAALIVALGSAGLVQALDHRPGSPARAELTWSADQAVRVPLEGIITDLNPIALDFDALGAQGRQALAALVASDPDALDNTLKVGQTLVQKINVETAGVRDRVNALPGIGPGSEGRLSSDLRVRVATVQRAVDSTTGIAEAWNTLSTGASTAIHLTTLLSAHDTASGEAVKQGSQGNYTDAVKALDKADPALADARQLRDILANSADVSTLTQWLDRNAAIDAALRRLYTVLAITGGKVTEEARQAFEQVKQAQEALPPDTRALIVIMSDIARAGLNQAVIKIEEGRGKLADAIALLSQLSGPSPAAGPGGSGAPEDSGGPAESPGPGSSGQPELTPPDA